jgi:hypothetical protein
MTTNATCDGSLAPEKMGQIGLQSDWVFYYFQKATRWDIFSKKLRRMHTNNATKNFRFKLSQQNARLHYTILLL